MERLYAPWRMAYVEQPHKDTDSPHCVFCQKAEQNDDIANLVLKRGQHVFVLLNLFPYNNGHLLIAPYRHTACLNDFDDATHLEVALFTRQAQAALENVFHPDGYNLGMNLGAAAGAGIADHLHLHIVPRWNGDTNFMPVLADIKVLPDSLEHSASLLREAWI